MFIGDESGYRKVDKKDMEEFFNKKLCDLKISKALRIIIKADLLVSYDFNSLYPSVESDKVSTWPN